MVANAAMLTKPDVVAYVGQNAPKYNLDPAAVLAVANHEGLKEAPGSKWWLGGEAGYSFGPPSWYQGSAANPGAGWAIVQQQGSVDAAAQWSWTPAGIDYWLQKVAEEGRAQGLTGLAAITNIVKYYERPRADLIGGPTSGEIGNAWKDYQSFQQQIGNPIVTTPDSPGNITIPPNIFIPGQTSPGQLPIPSNPQSSTQTTTGAKFSLHLFDLPSGPVNLTLPWDFSGILLFLAALLAIIIGALLWDKSRTVIVNTGSTAAMFA